MLLVRFVATLLIGFMTAGCNYSWIPFTYRPDIHQGNVITQEMVDQLRPGLSIVRQRLAGHVRLSPPSTTSVWPVT